jgi:hypothetical protein
MHCASESSETKTLGQTTRDDLVFARNLARMLDEVAQHVERLGPQVDIGPVRLQGGTVEIQREPAEAVSPAMIRAHGPTPDRNNRPKP